MKKLRQRWETVQVIKNLTPVLVFGCGQLSSPPLCFPSASHLDPPMGEPRCLLLGITGASTGPVSVQEASPSPTSSHSNTPSQPPFPALWGHLGSSLEACLVLPGKPRNVRNQPVHSLFAYVWHHRFYVCVLSGGGAGWYSPSASEGWS